MKETYEQFIDRLTTEAVEKQLATVSAKKRTKANSIERTRKFEVVAASGEGLKCYCPHRFTTDQKFTVNLDWFQVRCTLSAPGPLDEWELGQDFNRGGFYFHCLKGQSKQWRYFYEIKFENQLAFTMSLQPQNARGEVERRTCVIKMENERLYADWWGFWLQFAEWNIDEIKALSRIDIAIDGLNYIKDLMDEKPGDLANAYGVKRIGKANVNGYNMNRISGAFNGWKVGNPKAPKQLSIYNKTREIQNNSDKKYIEQFWQENGLNSPVVHRFEMRMNDTYFKQISGDKLGVELSTDDGKKMVYSPEKTLEAFTNDRFCVDFVRKACEGLFMFVFMDNKNVSRCTKLDLLPVPEYNLTRTQKEYNGKSYKAKMQVHNTYAQVSQKLVELPKAVEIIKQQLAIYDLYDWYVSRLGDFGKKYFIEDEQTLQELKDCAIPSVMRSDDSVKRRMIQRFWNGREKQIVLKLGAEKRAPGQNKKYK